MIPCVLHIPNAVTTIFGDCIVPAAAFCSRHVFAYSTDPDDGVIGQIEATGSESTKEGRSGSRGTGALLLGKKSAVPGSLVCSELSVCGL